MGRKAYYRVGANSGPGFDAATGRHSVVVLAVWNQIATVIALTDAGYTVIRPAARFREAGESSGYFWDSDIPGAWTNGTDKPLMGGADNQILVWFNEHR